MTDVEGSLLPLVGDIHEKREKKEHRYNSNKVIKSLHPRRRQSGYTHCLCNADYTNIFKKGTFKIRQQSSEEHNKTCLKALSSSFDKYCSNKKNQRRDIVLFLFWPNI